MKIIDTHLHLDYNFKTVDESIKNLKNQLKENNIVSGILLHLAWKKWTIEQISDNINTNKIKLFFNPDPNSNKDLKNLQNLVDKNKVHGVKLHPRFQEINFRGKNEKKLIDCCAELNIPVLICSFFDGITLKKKIEPQDFCDFAQINHKTNFIFAHFGGYKYLDFMMIAKYFDNIYLDLSFTPFYFRETNIVNDLVYACKSLKFDKIFYGSDFPEVLHNNSIKLLNLYFNKNKISKQNKEKIFYQNAKKFFKF